MSNCCMGRSAKFHVESAVRFLAIANIRKGGGVKRAPPVKRGLTLARTWGMLPPVVFLSCTPHRLR